MIDLKGRLKEYIPSMFEVLKDEQISWVGISKTFEKNYRKRLAKMLPGQETMEVEASFYDLISARLKGNTQAIRQMDFFDKLFQEIGMRLTLKQKQWLKTTIFNILISTDFKYLDYFGELAILNQAIKSGNYTFNQTEFGLGNGKSADFYFHDIKSNRPVLIEVVNAVLTRELAGDEDGIKRFLSKRLTDKIEDKRKSDPNTLPFQLIPVIWGPAKDLQILSDFYKRGNSVDVPNTIEACAYCSFTRADGSYIHRFGSLSSLFSQEVILSSAT